MLRTDISTFLVIFFLNIINFGAPLYLVYPQDPTNSELLDPHPNAAFGHNRGVIAPEFEDWRAAFQKMIDVAFMGDTVTLRLDDDTTRVLNWEKTFTVSIFLLVYFLFILMTTILLLNLLIAMMSTTYEEILEKATQAWRFNFARCVTLLEIAAGGWPFKGIGPFKDLFLGEPDPSSPMHFMPGDIIEISQDGTTVVHQRTGFEAPLLSRELVGGDNDRDVALRAGGFAGRLRHRGRPKKKKVAPTPNILGRGTSFMMKGITTEAQNAKDIAVQAGNAVKHFHWWSVVDDHIVEQQITTDRGEEIVRFRNVLRRYCELTHLSWKDENGNEVTAPRGV